MRAGADAVIRRLLSLTSSASLGQDAYPPIVTIRQLVNSTASSLLWILAEAEFWPALVSSFRSIRVVDRSLSRRTLRFEAELSGGARSWIAEQDVDIDGGAITFRMTGGFGRGTIIRWNVCPVSDRQAEFAQSVTETGQAGAVSPFSLSSLYETAALRLSQIAEGRSLVDLSGR